MNYKCQTGQRIMMKNNTKNCLKYGSLDLKINDGEWQCNQCGLLFCMFGDKV